MLQYLLQATHNKNQYLIDDFGIFRNVFALLNRFLILLYNVDQKKKKKKKTSSRNAGILTQTRLGLSAEKTGSN
jgi:hypothetical protein